MTRDMSVNGAFYPNTKEELLSSFAYFDEIVQEHFKNKSYNKDVKALIVPHAGYVYSGLSAYLAYKNVTRIPKRVIVIGPSHRVAFEGVSIGEYTSYATPLGAIDADIQYANFLKSKFNFTYIKHEEHSTEVQFPFIKYFFKETQLIELVYSNNANLDGIIETILSDSANLLIISTDLSHFYSQKKANELDTYCIKGIEKLDTDILKKGEACGMLGVKSLIRTLQKNPLHVKSIDYRTSGDITGDMDRVVGYYSAIVY